MKPQPTMRVPIVTSVSGGRGVPSDESDWEITGFREVSVVDGADSAATFFITAVDGPSLEAEHIIDGDWLLCRVTARYEIGRLGIWQTPSGRTAKYAFYEDGIIVLHNDNGWRQEWQADEIRLLGIVERIERDHQPRW